MDKDGISEYHLERYVLEELPRELEESIRKKASEDPELRAAVQAIERSNRDILSSYPPPAFQSGISARLEAKKRRPAAGGKPHRFSGRGWLLPISTAALISALLLVILIPGLREKAFAVFGATEGDLSRVKGIEALDLSKTQLLIFRQNQIQVEILGDERRARAGELLQLAYIAAGDAFGTILSIDGRGAVTLHFPADSKSSTALVQNKRFMLPNAIELDDAPAFERFFLVTSQSPIDVAGVLAKAESLAADPEKAERSDLELPDGLEQYSVLIRKGDES